MLESVEPAQRSAAAPTADPGLVVGGGPSDPHPPPTPLNVDAGDAGVAHGQQISGTRLLRTDIRMAYLLLNEARHRTIQGVFGVSRDQSNLVTLIALGVLAQASRDRAVRVVKAPGGPRPADALLGTALLKELVHRIAGPDSKDTPLIGTLVAIAVLGRLSRPVFGESVRAIRASARRTRAIFGQRYGHAAP